MFQSPRLGEFVSDYFKKTIEYVAYQTFQSPRSEKIVSDRNLNLTSLVTTTTVSIP